MTPDFARIYAPQAEAAANACTTGAARATCGAKAAEDEAATILVVDDVDGNRVVLTLMLEMSGYHVECAPDAEAALDALARRDFSLILMDLAMPDCDGLTATHRIRSLETRRHATPIIGVTASVNSAVEAECLAAGMQDYLPKPVTLKKLQDAVTRWAA